MTNHLKYESIAPTMFLQCKVRELEQKANIIKRLRRIRNEILSNCAYHDKNSSEQIERLKKLTAPQTEIDFVNRCGFVSFELSQEMLKDYNIILDMFESRFNIKEEKIENKISENKCFGLDITSKNLFEHMIKEVKLRSENKEESDKYVAVITKYLHSEINK